MAITFNTTVSDVTMSTAKLSCKVSGASTTEIVLCGFQVHEGAGFGGKQMTGFFAESGDRIDCKLENGEFSLSYSDLKSGAVLSARPYVYVGGYYYGEPVMVRIKTENDYAPSVSSLEVNSITIDSASFSAVVLAADSTYPIKETGFRYRPKEGYGTTITVKCTPDSNGKITAKVDGLQTGVQYTVWAYANCSIAGMFTFKTFSTLGNEVLPGTIIADFDSVSTTGFKITASVVTNHASYKPSEVGFVLKRKGLSGGMTLDNGLTTREICTLSDGKFTLEKTAVGTGQYEVRAYLLSEGEDIYSDKSLDYSTTLSDCVPVLRMENPEKGAVSVSDSKEKKISVSLSAVLGMTYGSDVTAKGFLYKQGTAPSSISDGSTKVDVVAGFASAVSLSIPDTGYVDYHFVAFATSKNGTGYSVPKRVRIWWKDGI